jgi:hypothetical protein
MNAFGADSPRHPFVERVFHGIARARHDHFRAEPTPANTRLALETNWLSYRLALGQRANFTPSQFAGPVVSPLERLPRILLAMDPPRPELARTVMEHCWQLNRMMARFDPKIAGGDFLPAQITEAGLDLAEFEALPEPPDFWASPEEAIDVAPVLQWLAENHGPLPDMWELYPDFRRAPADFEVPGEQSLPPVHAIIDGMADDADAIIARLRVEYADEIDRARKPAGDAP